MREASCPVQGNSYLAMTAHVSMQLSFLQPTALPFLRAKPLSPQNEPRTTSVPPQKSCAVGKPLHKWRVSMRQEGRPSPEGFPSRIYKTPSKLLTLSDYHVLGPKQINPQAEKSNRITEELCEKCGIVLPNFSEYISSTGYVYPKASLERLVALNLWVGLMFYIDDHYERRTVHEFVNDHEGIRHAFKTILRIMFEGYEPEDQHVMYPICAEIYTTMTRRADPRWIPRMEKSIHEFLMAVLVDNQEPTELSVDEYCALRSIESGMDNSAVCVEFAWGIYLEDEVLRHEKLQEMIQVTSRIGWMGNDILSYKKEVLDLGSRFNLVHMLMEKHKLTLPEAVHEIMTIINENVSRFAELEKDPPVWGDEKIDRDVRCFIQGLKDVLLSVYHWYMSTNRYRSPNHPIPELREVLPG